MSDYSSYRNANPDASPLVLVMPTGIPMALQKGVSYPDALKIAQESARSLGYIDVYDNGVKVARVVDPEVVSDAGKLGAIPLTAQEAAAIRVCVDNVQASNLPGEWAEHARIGVAKLGWLGQDAI